MSANSAASALRGACHCGRVQLELACSSEPASLPPRCCDCDYCRRFAAAWVSDPAGSLRIEVSEPGGLLRYRQGHSLADFLICAGCGCLVAVCCEIGGQLFAAANSRVLERANSLGSPQTVSPRLLDGGAKTARWRDIWFADVRLDEA